ncbi:MAG: hypothetical protein H8E66_02370 [Planctomycetes bacterium]|nr:hypothetical protein [Planctomycetota bacterium]
MLYLSRSGTTAAVIFASAIVAALAGCSTHAHRVRSARQAYFANDLSAAASLLELAEADLPQERDCLVLDRAVVLLAQGDPAGAETLLRDVRDKFDYLEQNSVAESGLSLLTDDTVVAYAGEDYEKVMVRAMLAISNIMYDGADATAYCLQVDQKQREFAERAATASGKPPEALIANVAIGAYLRGVVQEESHVHYDDAERAFAKVSEWEPTFEFAQFDLERVRTGVHSAPGNGVVYLFALVGRGPYKEERVAAVTSDSLLIADRLISAAGDHTLPPTIAPIKIPMIVVPANTVDSVAVDVNGNPEALTQTVTDVGKLAVAQFAAEEHEVIARAIVRRVLKKTIVYASKESLDIEDGVENFALDAAGVMWEASEQADTRCWGLLPETIQVLRLELPIGTHQLTLHPAHHGQPIGAAHTTRVEVLDGRNTYVLASFPTQDLVGQILTSQPPRSTAENRSMDHSYQASRPSAEPSETATFLIR